MVLAIPTDKGTQPWRRQSPLGSVISLSALQILPRSSSPLYDVPSYRKSRARLLRVRAKNVISRPFLYELPPLPLHCPRKQLSAVT